MLADDFSEHLVPGTFVFDRSDEGGLSIIIFFFSFPYR
jgi:hypothetical protein